MFTAHSTSCYKRCQSKQFAISSNTFSGRITSSGEISFPFNVIFAIFYSNLLTLSLMSFIFLFTVLSDTFSSCDISVIVFPLASSQKTLSSSCVKLAFCKIFSSSGFVILDSASFNRLTSSFLAESYVSIFLLLTLIFANKSLSLPAARP